MVFSSNIFLFFFLPIFLMAYFITPQKFRNYTLLLFSLVFYAYGAPDFVFLLVGECILNYFIVKAMGRCRDDVHPISTKKGYVPFPSSWPWDCCSILNTPTFLSKTSMPFWAGHITNRWHG